MVWILVLVGLATQSSPAQATPPARDLRPVNVFRLQDVPDDAIPAPAAEVAPEMRPRGPIALAVGLGIVLLGLMTYGSADRSPKNADGTPSDFPDPNGPFGVLQMICGGVVAAVGLGLIVADARSAPAVESR